MVSSQVNSLRGILKGKSALQNFLKVTSIIDFSNEDFSKIIKSIFDRSTYCGNMVLFKDYEDASVNTKSLAMLENNVKYLIGKNVFSSDIYKSKHNQEVLKVAGVMAKEELKDLKSIFIDATTMLEKFSSKILKISDNILILANTIEDNLDKIINEFSSEKWDGQGVQIIFINKDIDLEWQNFFKRFEEKVSSKCNVDFNILGIINEKTIDTDIPCIIEKSYLDSIVTNNPKNLNFLDFIINTLS